MTLLRRFADRYITLQGVFRVVLEEGWLAEQIKPCARRWISCRRSGQQLWDTPATRWFCQREKCVWTPAQALWAWVRTRNLSPRSRRLGAELELRDLEPGGDEQRQFQAVITRQGHDRSQLHAVLRSSVVEAESVFLSVFDQPGVLDVFCLPRAAYLQGRPSALAGHR